MGPLRELRAEMQEASEHYYHQTTLRGFLQMANKYLDADVNEKTIELVGEDLNGKEWTLSKKFISPAEYSSIMGAGVNYANWPAVAEVVAAANSTVANGMTGIENSEMWKDLVTIGPSMQKFSDYVASIGADRAKVDNLISNANSEMLRFARRNLDGSEIIYPDQDSTDQASQVESDDSCDD
jgi:hypothetical protein